VCVCVCVCVHVRARVYVRLHGFVHVRVSVFDCVCMCVRARVWMRARSNFDRVCRNTFSVSAPPLLLLVALAAALIQLYLCACPFSS